MTTKAAHAFVDDRPADKAFRVHSDIYADPRVFEDEQRYIFDRTWNFLGLASQVANPNDFVASTIGRTPVVLTRNTDGEVNAFVNACRHKGAMVTRIERGNSKFHVCPYHGWVYDSHGKNRDIKDRNAGGYAEAFDQDSHDLIPVPRVESYKGLIFGSMNPDVIPLDEFLGDLGPLLDLAMEQGPNGMEFIPGRSIYTYDANWKLQMDNGMDYYHLTSTHSSFMEVVKRREAVKAGNQDARQFDWNKRLTQEGGMFSFRHGHAAIWLNQAQPEKRPIYPALDEVRARVGDMRAEWMLKLRNITIFPNLQIADSTSLILRTFRPLAADRTEMRVYCMAPIGEAPELRAWRLRQFEDFFNPSGFATPDDTVTYEACQSGYRTPALEYLQGYARGISAVTPGANQEAADLGLRPTGSIKDVFDLQNEACFHSAYREWSRMMAAGAARQPAYPGQAGTNQVAAGDLASEEAGK
jgi:benzoate/toluate 1,2-dioxygenase alpha subunit